MTGARAIATVAATTPAASPPTGEALRCRRFFRTGDDSTFSTYTYRDGLLVEIDGTSFSYVDRRLVSVQRFSEQVLQSTTTIEWNEVPRPVQVKIEIPGRGVVETLQLRYDEAGRLTELLRAHGRTLLTYNANGRIARASDPSQTSVSMFKYNDRGQLSQDQQFFNGEHSTSLHYEYDERGRNTVVRVLANGSVFTWDYSYDELDRRTEGRLTINGIAEDPEQSYRLEYDEGLTETHCGLIRPPAGFPVDVPQLWERSLRPSYRD